MTTLVFVWQLKDALWIAIIVIILAAYLVAYIVDKLKRK